MLPALLEAAVTAAGLQSGIEATQISLSLSVNAASKAELIQVPESLIKLDPTLAASLILVVSLSSGWVCVVA